MTSGTPPKSCLDPVQLEADIASEGSPEIEFNPGVASRIAAKPVAAGALIRNEAGEVLFVVPNYKPVLDIPGGIADPNESPRSACKREVEEELDIELRVGRLLVVDWVPRNGVWRDSQQFIFDGGVLTDHDANRVSIRDEEISGVRFFSLDAAADHVRPSLLRRLVLATDAASSGQTLYAEFGRLM
ncbi:NUDIX hydrolase [Saccharothrix sp. NPDC042600]|uniref:NUDIX hydrolase n=1 Tax=Saccharothrix TaxID=2071 RepID=UPI0033FB551F|nr:NUDIX hydrolase [Saccharothrix mutabilis subsp. capreolus]